MTFRFAYPILLGLLAAVAGTTGHALWKKPDRLTYPGASALARLAGGGDPLRGRLPVFLRAAALTLLVLATARPQLYNVTRESRTPGVDIMLCIDTSGTMQAMDFKLGVEPVTRLTAVKKVVRDFIMKRDHDRIGLVVFGEGALTQSPLTLDKGLLLSLVDKMEVGMAGDRTAIGSAVALAGKRLKSIPAASRILILLTDGRHNAGEIDPLQAAEAVRALGVKLYAVGVGGQGPAPFKADTIFGPRIVYERVDLDEETLAMVARVGGGTYFRASDSARLAEIYELIDREEKTEIVNREFFHFRELYHYFLVPSLLLLALEIGLGALFLRTIP